MLSIETLARIDDRSLPARGACFGFQLYSDLPFSALRPDASGDVVRVFAVEQDRHRRGKLVHEWRQKDFLARLYFDGGVYTFAVDGIGSVEIDPRAGTICTFGIDDPVAREEIVCGVPLAVCLLHRGDLALHAAAVEIDGGAVVLAGPGTYGKTTLAAAFAGAGHRLLSEDLVCLRPGSSPAVLPGPAALRLRHDVVGRVSVAETQHERANADRTRLTIAVGARGDSGPVPLRAILFLRDGEDPTPTSRTLSLAEAIPDLWALCLRLSAEDDARCFRGLVDAVSRAPIYDLHRRLRFEDLAATVAHVTAKVAP